MEDIIGVVGEIYDEHEEVIDWKSNPGGWNYVVQGHTDLEKFLDDSTVNRRLGHLQ
jgi:CBS domain containing-hemolysin-like protein